MRPRSLPNSYSSGGTCAVVASICLLLFGGPQRGSAQPAQGKPAQEKSISFINDVAPILNDNCFVCHNAVKVLGKYDMTTFEKLMAGGPSGKPIVAGKPEDSEFYTLLVSTEERRMPPRDMGRAVPKDKAALIARWIKEGAKLDTGLDPKADLVKELRLRWKPPVLPKGHPAPVIDSALAVTPDGKQLIVGGHHELTVWAIDTGKPVKRITTRTERAYALGFLPDGKLAVAGGRPGREGDVCLYDVKASGKVENDIEILDGVHDKKVLVKHLLAVEDSVLCLAVTPDGKTLAAGGCDRAVHVFDLSDGLDHAKLQQTVKIHTDWVLGCALSADGKYLVTAGRDKITKVWDLKAREPVVTFRPDVSGAGAPNPIQPKSIEPTTPTTEAPTKVPKSARPEATAGTKAALVLFGQYCVTCHGTDGRGKELRARMPLPDFSSRQWQERSSSAQVAVSILDGKGKLMPAFRGQVTEEQARDLAAYVKAFGPESAQQPTVPTDDFQKQFRELDEQLKDLQKQYKSLDRMPPTRP
jgi:mono/diheme cytochrome c family protein